LGDCLKENPLAALALGVLTPPPGDVFEGFPPFSPDPVFPEYPK
jgi:hypothetical protein